MSRTVMEAISPLLRVAGSSGVWTRNWFVGPVPASLILSLDSTVTAYSNRFWPYHGVMQRAQGSYERDEASKIITNGTFSISWQVLVLRCMFSLDPLSIKPWCKLLFGLTDSSKGF